MEKYRGFYDRSKNKIEEELTKVLKSKESVDDFLKKGGVTARFTGVFADSETENVNQKKFRETLCKWMDGHLSKKGKSAHHIDYAILDGLEEGKYGSQHCLSIVQPYFESDEHYGKMNINKFKIAEFGNGSHQGGFFFDEAITRRSTVSMFADNDETKAMPDLSGGSIASAKSVISTQTVGESTMSSPSLNGEVTPAEPETRQRSVLSSPQEIPTFTSEKSNPVPEPEKTEQNGSVGGGEPTNSSVVTVDTKTNGGKTKVVDRRRRLAELEDLLELCRENGYDQ